MQITKSFARTLCLLIAFLTSPAFSAEPPATFKVGEFTFARPAKWEWVDVSSSMRKAQLRISDPKKKESAEIVFFEGMGGGTKANVDRWFSSFQEPKDKINAKVEEATIAGKKVTFVQADGTYLSGMPGAPKTPQPNYALAGAIIESTAGPVFIRMTGPAGLVKSTVAEFKSFVESGVKGK
jgi:hypothetical protein